MTTQPFPAIGNRYRADYGQLVFNLEFAADGETLRWADAGAADFDSAATTEHYTATFVRRGVFWVTWKEADGTTVSHVEDFENGIVHAAITMPDHSFYTLTGKLSPRD